MDRPPLRAPIGKIVDLSYEQRAPFPVKDRLSAGRHSCNVELSASLVAGVLCSHPPPSKTGLDGNAGEGGGQETELVARPHAQVPNAPRAYIECRLAGVTALLRPVTPSGTRTCHAEACVDGFQVPTGRTQCAIRARQLHSVREAQVEPATDREGCCGCLSTAPKSGLQLEHDHYSLH
jgi:hypothetical protein